jgi:riboflavin kinase/FMN adenylyltransferase
MEEKEYLFRKWGVENLVIIPFTREFAGIDGRTFINDILIGRIGMKYLVIGDDHRFGSDRSGGRELLEEMGRDMGFGFSSLGSMVFGDSRVSSSLVREYLKSGDLEKANQLLGFSYFMFGKVIQGNRLGRTIGFPTANIECCVDNKQVPEEGVYAVEVIVDGVVFGGMLNIGTRPTVNHTREKSIEVHIFDLGSDLYGKKLMVSFLYRLRDEMKFKKTDELKAQLKKDKALAIRLLGLKA